MKKALFNILGFLLLIMFFSFSCARKNGANPPHNKLWRIIDQDSNYYEFYFDSEKLLLFDSRIGFTGNMYSEQIEKYCNKNGKQYTLWLEEIENSEGEESERKVVLQMIQFFRIDSILPSGISVFEPIESGINDVSDSCYKDMFDFEGDAYKRFYLFKGKPDTLKTINETDTLEVIERQTD